MACGGLAYLCWLIPVGFGTHALFRGLLRFLTFVRGLSARFSCSSTTGAPRPPQSDCFAILRANRSSARSRLCCCGAGATPSTKRATHFRVERAADCRIHDG